MEKPDSRRQAGRTLIDAIKEEMDEPRLTESVRSDRRYKTSLLDQRLLEDTDNPETSQPVGQEG